MARNEWQELSCGGCGEAKHRIRALPSQDGTGSFQDVAVICVGCGSVTHLVVPKPRIVTKWGRPAEGEKDDGILAPMEWPRNDETGEPL